MRFLVWGRSILGMVVLTVLVLCVSCKLLAILEGDQDKAAEIATRLGIEPSWDAIRKYLYEEAFHPGMSRDEVYEILAKVGPYRESVQHEGRIVRIGFREIGRHIQKFTFIFDNQGRLVGIRIDSP